MDATPESFAYRCLPLAIANASGWEISNAIGFRARWRGGSGAEEVEIELDGPCEAIDMPVSLFGQGVITFHVAGLFRTSPGWNLWVGGPPNHIKDGVAALTGIIETDWSPYSFTMNWRLTRPDQWVRFEIDEPICFFLPIERGVVDGMSPRFRPIEEAPELERQFRAWSHSRDAFHARVKADPPTAPSDKWQKLYYRGVDAEGRPGAADHQSKLRTAPFVPPLPEPPKPAICPVRHAPEAVPEPAPPGDRLLRIRQEMRALSPRLRGIRRLRSISPDRFLDEHYAAGWPLILSPRGGGQVHGTPGLPAIVGQALSSAIGSDGFVAMEPPAAMVPPALPGLLRPAGAPATAPLRIGAVGAFAPLAQEPANRFCFQMAGRARFLLAPPGEGDWLRDARLDDLLDRNRISASLRAHDASIFDIMLAPGDALFVPIGWWTQMRALEPSALLSRTDFVWRNDWTLG